MRANIYFRSLARVVTRDLPFRWSLSLFALAAVISFFVDDAIDWKGAFILGAIPFVIAMLFTIAGNALADGIHTYLKDNKTSVGITVAILAASVVIGKDAREALDKQKERANG